VKISKINYWTGLIVSFLVGQGSVQILNLVSGFLLLRWLSVEAYAQYSIAFGFQSTLGILVDLGFSGSIIALVGDRIADKEVIAAYVSAARYFRNWLSILLIPIGLLVFPTITAKHEWDWTTQILLLGSIVSSLFFQGWVSYYSPPLLMHKQLKEFYKPQILSSGFRFLLCLILYLTSTLTAWAAVWVNSTALLINGYFYKASARKWMTENLIPNQKFRHEMLAYLSPLIPGIIFTAFQGQISLFITAWFGQSQNIAAVAALGRVSQLFVLLSTFNGIIIAPYIAKLPHYDLLKRYLQVLGVAVLVSISLSTFAFFFPEPLLWIMGARYQHLHIELSWTILATCISYIGGVMWTMHSARKWIYWWGSFLYISLLLITQILCVNVMDLSTTLNVVYFSLITTFPVLFIHILTSIYGFNRKVLEVS